MGKSSAVSSLLMTMKSKFDLIIAFIGSANCNPVLQEQPLFDTLAVLFTVGRYDVLDLCFKRDVVEVREWVTSVRHHSPEFE